MTDKQKHLETFAHELGKEIARTLNEDWRKWPRNAAPVERAVALDVMATKLHAMAAGLQALAERTSELAGDLLDGAPD
ncbi:MAG TPA: hypothetical protein VN896_07945 [Methylomirabilota bacterium]|jgi:hypothetical protein|nr:hypothetical protein [Methylomirabilota bacterium]